MNKHNFLIILCAVLLVLLVCLLAFFLPQRRQLSAEAPSLSDQVVAASSPSSAPAEAWLLISVGGMLYEPIPLQEECSYTVRRDEAGMENVIHVTPSSIVMESSTCDNQDCVLQGEVSLENMSKRVLGNMIICLPNEVTLELHTPESLAEVLLQMEE